MSRSGITVSYGSSSFSFLSNFCNGCTNLHKGVISIFLNFLRLALCPKISILEKVQELLKRVCIVWQLDEIFCACLKCPFGLMCGLVLKFLCGFFCLDDLSIGDSGVFRSQTIIVLGSICAFKSISAFLKCSWMSLCLVHMC
jgi:hypothetical protein